MKVFAIFASLIMYCESFHDQFIDDFIAYDTPTLLLISNQGYDDKHIHNQLINKTTEIGFRVKPIELKGMDTMDIAKNHRYVINLRAKKFHSAEKCQAYLQSNLVSLSDDIICEDYNSHLINSTHNQWEKKYSTDQKSMTLLSASLLKYNQLIDIILNNKDVENVICICLPEDIEIDVKKTPIRKWFPHLTLNFVTNCTNLVFDNKILAIVAKSPFHTDSTLPTAFYGTSNFLPEYKEWYPNSINLMTSWKPLKYGLVTFLKTMKWFRVGIVTDDDDYSDTFLNDLIPVFVKERIIFNVQECATNSCDFTHALVKLRAAQARIIFLNVGEKNADKLMQTIANLHMDNVKWIVRDWPFKKVLSIENIVFSITLSPVYNTGTESVPYLSSIRRALYLMNKSTNGVYDRDQFRHNFMKYGNQKHDHASHAFVIHNKDVICAMKIVNDDVLVYKFTKIFDETPSDLPMQCLVRSNDFFEPCDHQNILLLLLIIIMFILMSFITIVFFSRKPLNYKVLL